MIFIYFLYFQLCAFEEQGSEMVPDSSSTSSPNKNPLKRKVSCSITVGISVASYLLALFIGVWAVIEVYMQIRVDRRYLRSWRTWVIRLTIFVMGVTLWPGLQLRDVYNITFQYPIASVRL
jgi:hypothetical protein